jgi:hypothetical protein
VLPRRNRRDTVCASCSRSGPSTAVQFGHRPVQHLVRQATGQCFHHRIDRFALGQLLAGAHQGHRAPVLGLAVQRLDQRHCRALVEPVREAQHAGVDDGLGLLHGGLALLAGGLHQCRQVVDGVEVDVAQRADLGFDVARHGQVDHEHRTVSAQLQRPFHGSQPDDRQRAGGARDDRVVLVQTGRKLRQAQRLRTEARGQTFTSFERAIGDRHALGGLGGEVRGHQFDHLAGADEQHVHVGQLLEQLTGQTHGGGGHADRVGADLGGGTDLLGDRKGALEQLVQRGAQGAGFVGLAHRLLHLAQDLRLAQHHRIQARRHAEGVAGGRTVFQHVGVVLQVVGADAACGSQPRHRGCHQFFGSGAVGGHVQLGAIAGRHQRRFGRGPLQLVLQAAQSRGQRFGRERQAAPQVQRCGGVIQAEGEDGHGADCRIGACGTGVGAVAARNPESRQGFCRKA